MSEQVVGDLRVIEIKVGLMILEDEVYQHLQRDDYSAAMKSLGAFAPEMNQYLDRQAEREQIVVDFWIKVCGMVGVDWRKIA